MFTLKRYADNFVTQQLGENFEALYLTDRVEKKLEIEAIVNDHVETTPYK